MVAQVDVELDSKKQKQFVSFHSNYNRGLAKLDASRLRNTVVSVSKGVAKKAILLCYRDGPKQLRKRTPVLHPILF